MCSGSARVATMLHSAVPSKTWLSPSLTATDLNFSGWVNVSSISRCIDTSPLPDSSSRVSKPVSTSWISTFLSSSFSASRPSFSCRILSSMSAFSSSPSAPSITSDCSTSQRINLPCRSPVIIGSCVDTDSRWPVVGKTHIPTTVLS